VSEPVYSTIGGEPLTAADYRGLEKRYITPEDADRNRIFRADSALGGLLVGRNGNANYQGFVIPYFRLGTERPIEYLLRRDVPDYEQVSDGTIKQKGKYLWPPGGKNQLYFPADTDPAWLKDFGIRRIIVEGPLKAIALWRYYRERGENVLVIAISGVSSWHGTVGKGNDENGKRIDIKGPISDFDLIEWRDSAVQILFDRNVLDNKNVRIERAKLTAELRGRGARVSFIELPEDFMGNGVDDFLFERGPDAFTAVLAAKPAPAASSEATVSLADFRAYMPSHGYIFTPTREMWSASSVNSRIPPIATGKTNAKGNDEYISAGEWLDRNRPVEQMTWAPGQPEEIHDRLISEGGWFDRPGMTVFNLYRGPQVTAGDPRKAKPWLKHIYRIYPRDTKHIVRFFAHRVQHPGVKINHSLFLGGGPGIGKDSSLEPVKYAVGPWNFIDVSPAHLLGRFNGYTKSVIMRINEVRDMGDFDRYSFYEHSKLYMAAPPDVIRVDEKNLREHYVPNVTGVVITSNHKCDGIYLPADDRRHYVCWSDADQIDFPKDYWTNLYQWYESGGYGHVAAFLAALDLRKFDPKAPPKKTEAFWAIVDASRAPEDAELADVLDSLGTLNAKGELVLPEAVTLDDMANQATDDFRDWLRDRKNRRQIPHRLESVGYVSVRSPTATDGRWKAGGKRVVIYAKSSLPRRDQIAAAEKRSKRS
jgi:uncharacterized protein DUF3854